MVKKRKDMTPEERALHLEDYLRKSKVRHEHDMATLPLRERLLSKDSIVRSCSIEEASKMGEEGAKLLVEAVGKVRIAWQWEFIRVLGQTRWAGAADPIRSLMSSPEGEDDLDIVGTGLLALGNILGSGASKDVAPFLSSRNQDLRRCAWHVAGCYGDLGIVDDVWPAWRKGLMQLHRNQITIREIFSLLLLYWARNAYEVDPTDLIEVAKGFRKEFPILDKEVTEYDAQFGGIRTKDGGRISRSFSYGYGYWPEILSGDYDDPATLLPSPDGVNRWRKEKVGSSRKEDDLINSDSLQDESGID